MLRVGLIADTHGLLRPEAAAFLAGSDHIIHAGDIGDPSILDTLEAIAPVTAIRGNVDMDAWAARLPASVGGFVAVAAVFLFLRREGRPVVHPWARNRGAHSLAIVPTWRASVPQQPPKTFSCG